MNETVSIMEYKYKKYAKVSGEINLGNDNVTVHNNDSIDIRKQYIKQYLQLLSGKY